MMMLVLMMTFLMPVVMIASILMVIIIVVIGVLVVVFADFHLDDFSKSFAAWFLWSLLSLVCLNAAGVGDSCGSCLPC